MGGHVRRRLTRLIPGLSFCICHRPAENWWSAHPSFRFVSAPCLRFAILCRKDPHRPLARALPDIFTPLGIHTGCRREGGQRYDAGAIGAAPHAVAFEVDAGAHHSSHVLPVEAEADAADLFPRNSVLSGEVHGAFL
jgi:hypothetical protein